jgi:hypothetical protein
MAERFIVGPEAVSDPVLHLKTGDRQRQSRKAPLRQACGAKTVRLPFDFGR